MWYRCLLASVLGSILLNSASAQFSGQGAGNLRVHIQYSDNDHAAPKNLLVELIPSSGGMPVATGYTGDNGTVEFGRLKVGDYHVVVSGQGVEKTESDTFEVDSRKATQNKFVYVRSIQAKQSNATVGGTALVGAADLNVPSSANKEFQKATGAMARQDWKKAQEHLNKAIAIYPQYAAAFTNLGVVDGHLNDPAGERVALEQAISVNDHFAPAYFNLAVLCIRQNSYAEAETLLQKMAPLDPTNAKSLMLLANMQLLNQHFDAAIASAQRVHSLPHEQLALSHYIAARAYEHKNRPQEALAELQLFLKEEPQGPRADHVREEVKLVQQHVQ